MYFRSILSQNLEAKLLLFIGGGFLLAGHIRHIRQALHISSRLYLYFFALL